MVKLVNAVVSLDGRSLDVLLLVVLSLEVSPKMSLIKKDITVVVAQLIA